MDAVETTPPGGGGGNGAGTPSPPAGVPAPPNYRTDHPAYMRRYRLATGQTTTVSVGALALADLWLHGTARTRELILTEVGEPALHGCLLARRGLLDRPGSGSRLDYSGAPS